MKRSITVLVTILFMLAVLPLRMYYLAVNPESLPEISSSTQKVLLSSLRGEIYDCNMKKLVNRKSHNVIIARPEKKSAQILEKYLEKSEYQRLVSCIEESSPFICRTETENDNFLSASVFERYGDDGFCCHVLGYVNESDNTGVIGIEKGFDSYLKEDARKLFYTYNTTAENKMLSGGKNEIISQNYNSQKGIVLTIDYDIQRIAENAMWLYGIEKGAVVVLDSSNGEIRAMASLPKFNQNNIAVSLNDKSSPFLNRALCAYSVGSVFKLVVAAAAVKEGKEGFTTFCSGSLDISEKTFACSGFYSHGEVDVKKAMAHSCNTYFIRLALEIGKEKIIRTAQNMGFSKAFELAEGVYASGGALPDTEEITSDGVLANLAFGQGGLLATPLQIAGAYACVANGGRFIQPILVKAVTDSEGVKTQMNSGRYKYRAFLSAEAEKLKDILENNFNEGTCVSSKPENCISGGKTSTAQTGWIDEKGDEIFHSWFAGFAEKNGKNYTIVVFKENGESGGADCGPVFKEIAQRIANNH